MPLLIYCLRQRYKEVSPNAIQSVFCARGQPFKKNFSKSCITNIQRSDFYEPYSG